MAEKYVEKIKSASSGEIYTIKDPSVDTKQDLLVSGTNIKTINNQSILGAGNIEVGGGSGTSDYDQLSNRPSINNTVLTGNKSATDLSLQEALVSGVNIKTINDQSILGEGNLVVGGGSGGTSNYNDLENKPSIAGTSLVGDKSLSDLGIASSDALSGKQDALVSGTNIKTINNNSVLGEGNIDTIEKVTVTPNRDDGGFVAGTTYTDITFAEFAERLLNPYQAPGATITLSPTTAHKGTATNITATLKATKNSKALTVATLQVGSGTAEAVASLIPDGGTATQTASGLTETTVFTFVVGDGTESVTKTATVNFNEYKYHGIVSVAPADVTSTIIKGLTTDYSTAAKGYTYSSITMTNQRVCYAYPASYGNLSLIKDKNGYDVTGSYTKTTVDVDDISYNVYTMTDTGSLSNGSMQFS